MDHFKFEYEVCMDSVTTNQNLETDETKFLDIHGACTFHPQDLDSLYFFTSPVTKEFLLNKTNPYTTSRCISTDIQG
jgi:hypothetical protein